MTPTQHTIISSAVSTGFYFATHSWPGTISCFLSGIFIDLDHIMDLFIYKKKMVLSVRDLFNFCEREKGGRLFLILHSYELLALLWLAIYTFKLDMLWLGGAIGVTIHMLLDQVFNPVRPLTYFLCYRIKCGFVKEYIFDPAYFSKMDM